MSNANQQFLHLRLRQKYQDKITKGEMPNFLVEPEKGYITSLNSKLFMQFFKQRLGMSGTVGSKSEIREQYGKYGFRFIGIPSFIESKRKDLPPILTNPKYTKAEEEEADHIKLIVKQILQHMSSFKKELCSPVLIHCADKVIGEKILKALEKAIAAAPNKYKLKEKDGLKSFYGSQKPTDEERNAEESLVKKNSGENGTITISTLFARGTDIKPRKNSYLYTIQTYADTAPHSSEDLERSRDQKLGRAGRAGQFGKTRLILRRSEFKELYKDLSRLPATNQAVNEAISELNKRRNTPREIERNTREYFDDIKDVVYQEFFKYLEFINQIDDLPKKDIRDQLFMQWSQFLNRIDEQWEIVKQNSTNQSSEAAIVEFACREWNNFAKKEGPIRNVLNKWMKNNSIDKDLPEERVLEPVEVMKKVKERKPVMEPFYVKKAQLGNDLDDNISSDAVYSDFVKNDTSLEKYGNEAKQAALLSYVNKQYEWLSSPAYQKQLNRRWTLTNEVNSENITKTMNALLYLSYKSYRDGNYAAYAKFKRESRGFAKQIIWSADTQLIKALGNAQQQHLDALTTHHGNHELLKENYIKRIMSEWRNYPSDWKAQHFTKWWSQDSAMQSKVKTWLQNYQSKWWARAWVSNDRRILAEKFHQGLETSSNVSSILDQIKETKRSILENDRNHKRSMKSGLEGRLYQYLNGLETSASPNSLMH